MPPNYDPRAWQGQNRDVQGTEAGSFSVCAGV